MGGGPLEYAMRQTSDVCAPFFGGFLGGFGTHTLFLFFVKQPGKPWELVGSLCRTIFYPCVWECGVVHIQGGVCVGQATLLRNAGGVQTQFWPTAWAYCIFFPEEIGVYPVFKGLEQVSNVWVGVGSSLSLDEKYFLRKNTENFPWTKLLSKNFSLRLYSWGGCCTAAEVVK